MNDLITNCIPVLYYTREVELSTTERIESIRGLLVVTPPSDLMVLDSDLFGHQSILKQYAL